MLYVFETFSGIGSQASALERRGIPHKVLATCDWDMNAIIAYDLIHNGQQYLSDFEEMTDEELNELIFPLRISGDSKTLMTENAKKSLSREEKIHLLSAIKRTNNKIDITSIDGEDLPEGTNLLTYSFPCQDLSIAGYWKGNSGGIDKNAKNRSSLLWQVERILREREEKNLELPRFLLMENVTNILSNAHIKNFNLWKQTLNGMGYVNYVMSLDARNFGVPQSRIRTIMVSVHCGDDEEIREALISEYGMMTDESISKLYKPQHSFKVQDALRKDYSNPMYLEEAVLSNPNDTASRAEIKENNLRIDDDTEFVPTITTKQDRHPNSGLIDFPLHGEGKAEYRYLTPRECFLLMGYDEKDFQSIVDGNFKVKRGKFFTRDKLYRLAGNSIVVNVLESVFDFINDLNDFIDDLM